MSMSKFEQLTKYIDILDEDNFGTWIIDRENDGTPEHLDCSQSNGQGNKSPVIE